MNILEKIQRDHPNYSWKFQDDEESDLEEDIVLDNLTNGSWGFIEGSCGDCGCEITVEVAQGNLEIEICVFSTEDYVASQEVTVSSEKALLDCLKVVL